jgi:quercetin dioxygenase-like cupin family protein
VVAHSCGGAIVSRPEHGVWFDVVPGERSVIRVHSDQVGGRYTIMEHAIAPGASPPLHSHREEEVFEVLAGTMTFVCGDDRFEGAAGTVVIVPPEMPHSWANLSGQEVRLRTTFTPGGLEPMFQSFAGMLPMGIAALAATYGSKIHGPGIAS